MKTVVSGKKRALLICILVLGIALRLYRITGPVADWHSWRQSDTAAVARNFLRFGIDPLHPRYDDLSNIQSGKDNPQGYRMVEFPLYQIIGVWFASMFSSIPLEIWLRLVTIASSVGIAFVLYVLVNRYTDELTGLFAAFTYAALPYSVYYGRTILPDTLMVFLSLTGIASLDTYFRQARDKWHNVWFWLSAICSGLALLAKPNALFLLVPILYLFLRHRAGSWKFFLSIILFGIVSGVPLIWWRWWITQFPEGIPVYEWLLNGGNIRFKGAWFFWLFAERIGKLISGYWNVLLLGLGFASVRTKKEGWFFLTFVLGGLLHLIIVARGNVQHDYYQILIVPLIAIYIAKGMRLLWDAPKDAFSVYASRAVLGITLFFGLMFSWYTIRTYYWINRPEIVEAGKAADALLPADAKVIAPYNGDTTFLYQIRRQGWPIGFDVEKKLKMGATHYVTVSPTDADLETKDLRERFTELVRNDRFAIIDLTRPKQR